MREGGERKLDPPGVVGNEGDQPTRNKRLFFRGKGDQGPTRSPGAKRVRRGPGPAFRLRGTRTLE